jgi:hypothetical protein
MGNKNKNGNNIRIIADTPGNTFVDDGSLKLNATSDNDLSRESKRKQDKDISYSVRRHSDTTNGLRFKSSKLTKALSKQSHSPVYE